MDHAQPLGALNWKASSFVLVMAALPVAIVALVLRLIGFPDMGAMIASVALAVVPVIGLQLAQLSLIRAKVRGDRLVVGGGLNAISLPVRDLRLPWARIVTRGDPVLHVERRAQGVGIPGLRLGWFDRCAGRRAFMAVTNRERVLVLPTALGYDVLLSPDDPQAFLAALQALKPD